MHQFLEAIARITPKCGIVEILIRVFAPGCQAILDLNISAPAFTFIEKEVCYCTWIIRITWNFDKIKQIVADPRVLNMLIAGMDVNRMAVTQRSEMLGPHCTDIDSVNIHWARCLYGFTSLG